MKFRFWNWFETNKEKLDAMDPQGQEVYDAIFAELKKYNAHLSLELAINEQGVKQVIIGADSMIDEFDSVIQLCELAPLLADWKFIAFQPASETNKVLNIGPVELNPQQLWVNPAEQDGKLNLVLYFPEYEERYKSTYTNAAYLLLDMTLGEYYSAMGINELQHQALPESPSEHGLIPFSQLSEVFEQYKHKMSLPSALIA